MTETTAKNLDEKETMNDGEMNTRALDALLRDIEEASKVGESVVQRDKGTRFETLIREWLKRDSTYRDLFGEVLTYAEWAKDHAQDAVNAKDTGIDLVAKNADGSGFTAIQCKFWDKDKSVSKGEIDSFISASERSCFSSRLVVATNEKWSDNARATWAGLEKPLFIIDRQRLAASDVDWSEFRKSGTMKTFAKRTPFPYQQEAIAAVIKGFEEHDRGKLIMACGTGKTFTSLKIAEGQAGAGKLVAFVVPSLALLSQTLTDWKQQCTVPIRAFAVCSDAEIGKSDASDLDALMRPSELAYPATTNAASLRKQIGDAVDPKVMTVIFSTYQSIAVVSEAQKIGLRDIDLVICDEAHRTSGGFLKADKKDETDFTRVHDENFLHARKRLYMTATPRIYGEAAKKQEKEGEAILYSMDDEKVFGPTFYTVSFSRAVSLNRLVDYKVIVLGIDPSVIGPMKNYRGLVPGEIEKAQQSASNIPINLLAKILGCWHALAKRGLKGEVSVADDLSTMKRAVGFAQVIDYTLPKNGTPTKEELDRASKVSSKFLAQYFGGVVGAFKKALKEKLQDEGRYEEGAFNEQYALVCDTQHVDGSMGAQEKGAKLDWLRAEPEKDHCKILFNVRCLSEGVDVPALDAVMFLTPRESEIDVVQTVGRVMRVAPGKKRGYVIIPVLIPEGVDAHDALDKTKDFKTVWQVLRALRAIDSHFASVVDGQLQKVNPDKIEVICVTNAKKGLGRKGDGGTRLTPPKKPKEKGRSLQLDLDFSQDEIWEQEIKARIVKRVGNRHEWGDWAEEVSYLCQKQIENIETLVQTKPQSREQFGKFREEINATLNGNLDDHGICEMLGQHVVISPALDALFTAEFTKNNPIAKAMTRMCEALDREGMEKVNKDLQPFYADVKMRAANVKTTADRQTVILELFDKFFKAAFPKMQEKLGIVYTPVEVVDFINQSVEDLMKREFGKSMADDGVHILDPFTGTGTFMTRLMQSGIIPKDRLPYKYENEMHANELVPLAYYIASMNLESVYQEQTETTEYRPNDVMVWTDTFASTDKSDLVQSILNENNRRLRRQLDNPIRVIIGNPPYSVGQESANDDNANDHYDQLDGRLAETYVAKTDSTNKNKLYDSYIRAYRWASDKIGDKGIIGFVTNAGWIDTASMDGMRKCMAEEFNSIYVYHLKGNQRTVGEQSRKEGGKIFGQGSRAPVAIVLLVKNPADPEKGKIYFHAVDDYLTREEKLAQVTASHSAVGMDWTRITPDAHGDWLNQRDDSYSHFMRVDGKKTQEQAVFKNFSLGIATHRDVWCVNSSVSRLLDNMERTIGFYNDEVHRYRKEHLDQGFEYTHDLTKISWVTPQRNGVSKGVIAKTSSSAKVTKFIYRPFVPQYEYYDRFWNERVYQMPQLFPTSQAQNLVICVNHGAKEAGQIALMANPVADLHFNGDSQCFPRWIYTENTSKSKKSDQGDLFGTSDATDAPGGYTKTDAITDEALTHFQEAYPGESITKDDIFYYIYGILHSEDYRTKYANNLMKELPRIPRVATYEQFEAFADAGRKLADLHINFESVPEYQGVTISQRDPNAQNKYRITQMKYGKIPGKTGNAAKDKTVIVYNDNITITGIPLEAQEYVVNKRSALDWILEKARVSQDKDSGIVNDFNDYGMEMTPPNPRYPLSLVLRIITVSLRTMKIVKGLPKLEIHPLDRE